MKEERQIIFHGHYFQEFYLSVNDNVKEKIGYVFRLIKTVEKVSGKFLKHIEGTEDYLKSELKSGAIFTVYSVVSTRAIWSYYSTHFRRKRRKRCERKSN